MLNYYNHVFTLVGGLMQVTVHAPGCPAGWFGRTCRYPCHCDESLTCGMDGRCPNHKCKIPYFGPFCQHVDSIAVHGHNSIPSYITDNNHNTCNPDSTATSVHMLFKEPVRMVWYRIHASNNLTVYHRNFTTTVDNHPCAQTRLYGVNSNAIDVRCVYNTRLTNLTISGPLVPYLCTIYLSGGHNLALGQRVHQSSNYTWDPIDKVKAQNAIDGNTDNDYSKGSCSRTNNGSREPYWKVIFDRSNRLQQMNIYNTNTNKDWLSGFRVHFYGDGDHLLPVYTDHSAHPLLVYNIDLHLSASVLKIEIIAATNRYPLSLCEVQVMGEAGCITWSYGLDCEIPCTCPHNVVCNSITGACLFTQRYYCPSGTYGHLCEHLCSDNCQYNVCDARSGRCQHCVPGYKSDFCDQVCTNGTFGPNCSLNCSEKCQAPCDHITGICTCKEGFAGPLCSECASGWFGENCTETCQRICPRNRCNPKTGACGVCVGKRSGPKCADCPMGYFGVLCDIRCSVYCFNRTCDSVYGRCRSCIVGYRGEYCDTEIEELLPAFLMLPLLIPFILILVCFCMMGGGSTGPEE